jgi:hypothetical protein
VLLENISSRQMKTVFQRHSKGCGTAACATILGRDYHQVHAELYGLLGKCEGVFLSDMLKYLAACGVKYEPTQFGFDAEGKPRKNWPSKSALAGDNECLLLTVRVYPDSICSHYVVMDSKGRLHDPMFGRTNIKVYDSVENSVKLIFPRA